MDLTQLNEWLSKTTLGTIVLGAVGSALFAFIYWFTKNFLKPWLLRVSKYLMRNIFIKNFEQIDNELTEMKESSDFKKIISYFAYHITVIIFCTTAGVGMLIELYLSSRTSIYSSIFSYAVITMVMFNGIFSWIRISDAYKQIFLKWVKNK
jgi:hypothetical protein